MRPGMETIGQDEAGAFEGKVWVQFFEMEVGRDRAVFESEDRLDQTGDSRGGFEMANVRLDRSQHAIARPGPEDGGQRLHLDGIAKGGAGAVGLDITDLSGVDLGDLQRPAHNGLLGRAAGSGEAITGAILVGGAAGDDGQDRIAVAKRVREALEDHNAATFAPDETIGPMVERLAVAIGSQHIQPTQADVKIRAEHEIDTAGDGEVGLPRPEALACEVDRDERGGAGGIHGQGRPVEIEEERETIGEDAMSGARGGVGIERFPVASLQEVVIAAVAMGADEDPGGAPGKGFAHLARVLERLPCGLQEETLAAGPCR